ncbi:hypothetical protein MBANPS3_012440 [Mucor bainieri]
MILPRPRNRAAADQAAAIAKATADAQAAAAARDAAASKEAAAAKDAATAQAALDAQANANAAHGPPAPVHLLPLLLPSITAPLVRTPAPHCWNLLLQCRLSSHASNASARPTSNATAMHRRLGTAGLLLLGYSTLMITLSTVSRLPAPPLR